MAPPVLFSLVAQVQPGDVIGMQFPSGQVGAVYDTCRKSIGMTSLNKMNGWTNPEPGQVVTFTTMSSYYACMEHSVAAVVINGEYTDSYPLYACIRKNTPVSESL